MFYGNIGRMPSRAHLSSPSLILHQHLDFSLLPFPAPLGWTRRREDDNPWWFFFSGNTHTGLSRTISDATQAMQEKPISSRLSIILREKKRSKRFLYLFPTFRGRYTGGWESRRLFRLFSWAPPPERKKTHWMHLLVYIGYFLLLLSLNLSLFSSSSFQGGEWGWNGDVKDTVKN